MDMGTRQLSSVMRKAMSQSDWELQVVPTKKYYYFNRANRAPLTSAARAFTSSSKERSYTGSTGSIPGATNLEETTKQRNEDIAKIMRGRWRNATENSRLLRSPIIFCSLSLSLILYLYGKSHQASQSTPDALELPLK